MKALLTVLLLAVTSSAFARDRKMPRFLGEMKPVVGSWAEYDYEHKEGKKVEKGRVRMAVVSKEGDEFWIEQKFELTDPKPKKGEEGGIMKMLIGKDRKPKRMFVKTPMGVLDMTNSMKKDADDEDFKGEPSGKETVKTPAGSFEAQKLVQEGQTAWFKAGVGPYGLIKQVEGKKDDVTTMTLRAHGKDAKPELETPDAAASSSGPPGMPPGMMPGGMDIGEMMKQAAQQQQSEQQEEESEEEDSEE